MTERKRRVRVGDLQHEILAVLIAAKAAADVRDTEASAGMPSRWILAKVHGYALLGKQPWYPSVEAQYLWELERYSGAAIGLFEETKKALQIAQQLGQAELAPEARAQANPWMALEGRYLLEERLSLITSQISMITAVLEEEERLTGGHNTDAGLLGAVHAARQMAAVVDVIPFAIQKIRVSSRLRGREGSPPPIADLKGRQISLSRALRTLERNGLIAQEQKSILDKEEALFRITSVGLDRFKEDLD